jgi:hypothetical protein
MAHLPRITTRATLVVVALAALCTAAARELYLIKCIRVIDHRIEDIAFTIDMHEYHARACRHLRRSNIAYNALAREDVTFPLYGVRAYRFSSWEEEINQHERKLPTYRREHADLLNELKWLRSRRVLP